MRQNRMQLTLLATLLLALLRIPVTLAVQALLPDVTVNPAVNYLAAMAQSLLMFALPGWLLKPDWRMPPAEGKEKLGWALVSAGAAMTVRAVVTPLNAGWSALLGSESQVRLVAGSGGEWALMILALVIVPALAEEIFFRGALLPNLLQGASRMQALLLTTLLFALMHGSLPGLPGHLLISLLLTLLMMHSGRLIVPVGVHMLFNLLALCCPEIPAAAGWLCGILLAALLGWLLVRLPRGKARRMTAADVLCAAAVLAVMAGMYLI